MCKIRVSVKIDYVKLYFIKNKKIIIKENNKIYDKFNISIKRLHIDMASLWSNLNNQGKLRIFFLYKIYYNM